MIRATTAQDFDSIYTIINEAAEAYRDVIPADRWKEPYMPREDLQHEIDSGVAFSGYDVDSELVGVMGSQPVQDVTLIRHTYTLSGQQGKGIGSKLLEHLCQQTDRPILIGTWVAAEWAIRFYQGHGFEPVSHDEKERLLRQYWDIPMRQVTTSVVLAKWQ